jgi:hypothetical protein
MYLFIELHSASQVFGTTPPSGTEASDEDLAPEPTNFERLAAQRAAKRARVS